MNNFYLPYYLYPNIPDINLNPPTLYSILESIVNYGKDDKTKIKDLAKYGRTEIFDFDYILTDRLSKEEFETHILNHYLMRRIGFETVTAFKIALNCKINEITPIFNRLYDSINNWDLFIGDETTRIGTDITITNQKNNSNGETNSTNTSDKKFSDTPQSHIDDVKSGEYVTDYSFDTDNSNTNMISNSNTDINDNKNYQEKITHTPTGTEKIEIIKNIQNEIKNVYSIIYKELDDLFYNIIN